LIFTLDEEFMGPLEQASEELVRTICRHPILGFPDLAIQSPTKEKGTIKLTIPICTPAAAFPFGTPVIPETLNTKPEGKALRAACARVRHIYNEAEIHPDVPRNYQPRMRQRRVENEKVLYDAMKIGELREGKIKFAVTYI
jgi:hypothetical protein